MSQLGGGGRSSNINFEPLRYSGRKEWPHWSVVSNNVCGSGMEIGDYLRDTVRLIDRNETDTAGDMLHLLDESLVVEPLRGAIYQPQLAFAQLLVDSLELIPGLGRIYAFGRDAAPLEGIDLVLHQGKKGRDDNGDAGLAGRPKPTRFIQLGKGHGWYLRSGSADKARSTGDEEKLLTW